MRVEADEKDEVLHLCQRAGVALELTARPVTAADFPDQGRYVWNTSSECSYLLWSNNIYSVLAYSVQYSFATHSELELTTPICDRKSFRSRYASLILYALQDIGFDGCSSIGSG